MSVVSYGFLVFFVLVCFVYYGLPKNLRKLQWIVILAASLIFYASAGVCYLGIVTITAGIVYICSLFMQKNLDQQEQLLEGADRRSARKIKNEMKQKRKRMLTVALCVVIGILILFKGSRFSDRKYQYALMAYGSWNHSGMETGCTAWNLVLFIYDDLLSDGSVSWEDPCTAEFFEISYLCALFSAYYTRPDRQI